MFEKDVLVKKDFELVDGRWVITGDKVLVYFREPRQDGSISEELLLGNGRTVELRFTHGVYMNLVLQMGMRTHRMREKSVIRFVVDGEVLDVDAEAAKKFGYTNVYTSSPTGA
jgi:hypothetical protein